MTFYLPAKLQDQRMKKTAPDASRWTAVRWDWKKDDCNCTKSLQLQFASLAGFPF